jgi:hypothetical protein
MTKGFYALVLLVSAFLSGCTPTVRLYSGHELPSDEIVTLKANEQFNLTLKIDGKLVKNSSSEWFNGQIIQMLPGQHNIEWSWTNSSINFTFYGAGTLNTKAGDEYIIYFDYGVGGVAGYELRSTIYHVTVWATWIENKRTGQVVVGNKPFWADHNCGL